MITKGSQSSASGSLEARNESLSGPRPVFIFISTKITHKYANESDQLASFYDQKQENFYFLASTYN